MQRVTRTAGAIPAPRWGAIAAGAVVALAVQWTIGAFAGALGAAARARDSAGLGVLAGLAAIVVAFVALAVGAWLAVRLSATLHPGGATLHGVLVWALVLLATAPLSALGGRLEWTAAEGARGAAAVGIAALVALAGALVGARRGRRDSLGAAVGVRRPRVERHLESRGAIDVEDRWRDETHAH